MYLFGAYSPITGGHFEVEFSECNSDNFQISLNQFSQQDEDEFKIIVLDTGVLHKVKTLIIHLSIKLVLYHRILPNFIHLKKYGGK